MTLQQRMRLRFARVRPRLAVRGSCSNLTALPPPSGNPAPHCAPLSDADATEIQKHLVDSYATLQHEKMVERTCIQTNIKENLVQPLMDKVKAECLRRLASTPAERQTLEQQIGAVFEVHRGIETTEREEGALRRAIQPVPHAKRELIDRPDENGAALSAREYVVLCRAQCEAAQRAGAAGAFVARGAEHLEQC